MTAAIWPSEVHTVHKCAAGMRQILGTIDEKMVAVSNWLEESEEPKELEEPEAERVGRAGRVGGAESAEVR